MTVVTWNERQDKSFYESSVPNIPSRFKKSAVDTYNALAKKSQVAANRSLTRLNSIYNSVVKAPEEIRDYLYDHYYKKRNNQDFSLSEINRIMGEAELGDVPIASYFDEAILSSISEKKATELRHLLLTMSYPIASEQAEKIAEQQIVESGLVVPEGLLKKEVSLAARAVEPSWWKSQLRKTAARKTESVAIQYGMVNKTKSIYCSEFAIMRYRAMKKRHNEMMENTILKNECDYELSLMEIYKKGVSNPAIRRAELMTRIRGMEDDAKHTGKAAVFITITAPSRYHTRSAKYSGATPKDTQSYLNDVWARTRAQLARDGIKIYGFRVAEPHHDGTPHGHFLLFLDPKSQSRLVQIFSQYALEESPNEKGARAVRCKAVFITSRKGSAVAYIAKYISKNIDGHGVDTDNYGFDAASSAERIAAWASLWGIRQFQQIGGMPVTIWRTLRRIETEYDDEEAEAARRFADSGDWALFTRHGAVAGLSLYKVPTDKLNKYGEELPPQIVGVLSESTGEIGFKVVHQWEARERPWTRVNNCTLKNNYLEETDNRLEKSGFGLPPPTNAESLNEFLH